MASTQISAGSDSGQPFRVCRRVGKLVEIRVRRLRTPSDVTKLRRQWDREVADVTGRIVVCADCRELDDLPSEALLELASVLQTADPRLDRSAFVVSRERPVLRQQMKRLVTLAGHPGRRVCADALEATAWIGSHLSSAEQRRLDVFLR